MPTHIGIGFSNQNNPDEAFKAAAIEAKSQLNTVRTDAVIVFATASYGAGDITTRTTLPGLEILQRILQPKRLIGSITPGIILNNRVETRGVGVMAIISNELHFGCASMENINQLPQREAGFDIGRQLLHDHQSSHRNACFYFYDGLRQNGIPFSAGIHDGLGKALPMVGAVGLDGLQADYTQYFSQNSALPNAATGLLIGGASVAAIVSRQSWQPLGKPRFIDLAERNIIRTIDKKPAVNLYHDYFSDTKTMALHNNMGDIRLLYPLGIGTETPRKYLIRNPIDILKDGSIVCQGDIPTGGRVHLMIANKDSCRKDAQNAAHDLRKQLGGKPPKFILVFESCVRHKVLGHDAAQGLQAMREIFGHNIPIFGMYTLGEFVPAELHENTAETRLLNGSLVLLAIG